MSTGKETAFTIPPGGKESIHDRIKSLFRGRSMRKVAADWGLAYSTLNNYFSRSASPSIEVLIEIALKEGVSLEWLATGKPAISADDGGSVTTHNETEANPNELMATWGMLFNSLKEQEIKALLSLIMRVGVNGVLELAELKTPFDSAFMRLEEDEKERLWELHEAKKGASEVSGVKSPASLAQETKRVG